MPALTQPDKFLLRLWRCKTARGMLLTFEQDERLHPPISVARAECGHRISGRRRIHSRRDHRPRSRRSHGQGQPCFRGVRAVTAESTIEYIRPVPVDEDLVIEAHEVEKDGRNLHYVGEIINRAGKLLARGKGRFVEIDPDKFKIDRSEVSASGNQSIRASAKQKYRAATAVPRQNLATRPKQKNLATRPLISGMVFRRAGASDR